MEELEFVTAFNAESGGEAADAPKAKVTPTAGLPYASIAMIAAPRALLVTGRPH